jgi:sugar phosphate isomerase/epimerase
MSRAFLYKQTLETGWAAAVSIRQIDVRYVCELPEDGIGVAMDICHVWWAGQDFRPMLRELLLAGHPCRAASDWRVPTRDRLCDRGMIGDGVIDRKSIRVEISTAGYYGPPGTGDILGRQL